MLFRSQIIVGLGGHDAADRSAVRRVFEAARDIARRARIDSDTHVSSDEIDSLTGQVLLAAYPDRLAMARQTAGQFLMRNGGGTACNSKDTLAREAFIVAADIDGGRGTDDRKIAVAARHLDEAVAAIRRPRGKADPGEDFVRRKRGAEQALEKVGGLQGARTVVPVEDRKSTRLNSSH